MTRDEATEYLIDISYKFGNISVEYLTEKDGEKMREAINVLTNEQQTCADAVSRSAVLGLFAQNADAVRPYSKTWEEVKALPPITPQHTEAEIQKMQELEQAEIQRAYELGKAEESKAGRWRHYEGMLTCSECGAGFYDDIMEYCGDDVPKFCPDCGAKMVEPQESEEV